ncbi:MAG: helix-turn-helix domain-containing protein, partial [Dermatophilaceae bacterium]
LHLMLALAEMQLTTTGHPAAAQFDLWQQMVADAFTPVTLRRSDDEQGNGFRSTVQARRLGDLSLSWLTSEAQTVTRTADLVAGRPSGTYFLNLVLRGCGSAVQDGRAATALPGQFMLVDGDRPFTLDFGCTFDDICLMIPKEMLDSHLAAPELCTAVTVDGSSASGAMVLGALRALRSQRVNPSPRETAGITEHLVPLISLAVSEAARPSTPSPRTALLQAVLDEIDTHFADPDLNPVEVARRVSISVSYLTKLLASRGETFGRLLQRRRLDHAWAALAPGAPPVLTITSVAHASGFRDSAHFSRAFRATFSITPSQRRAGQAPTCCG